MSSIEIWIAVENGVLLPYKEERERTNLHQIKQIDFTICDVAILRSCAGEDVN
jgi:hypothetical protein